MDVEVSVIMPVHNTERYVAQAIRSVLEQTFRNWELLVIDDCSTDGSAALIESLAERDARIRYLRTKASSGSPAVPRNLGIEHAKGKYIAFLDSDDVWLADKLERQIRLFRNPDTAIVYSNYEKISEEGVRAKRIVEAPACVGYETLLLGNVIGGLTGMYDTEKVGKVYQPTHPHEDYIMWLSILKRGYVARNTGTVEALHRVRKYSVSSNKLKALGWQWDIYRRVENLELLKSVVCFLHYAYKAFRKSRK